MPTTIAPLTEAHFEQLHQVLDTVAREQRYLALTAAPPREESFDFYRCLVAVDQGHVALAAGQVVGWCDVQRQFGEARAHVGTLGIGLLPGWRGQGIGRRLITTAIDTAWARGLLRIELTVRADNERAHALYERVGFVAEGRLRKAMRMGGQPHDCLVMGLLKPEANGER